MRWLVILATVALATTTAGCGPGGVNRDAYVEKNEALLASTPEFPGATRVAAESGAYRGADGEGDPLWYITLHRFRLPVDASRAVTAFYKRRLGEGWLLQAEHIAGRGERVLSFCRRGESLSVNLESVGILEVAVDHDAFGKYGHPDSCSAQ